MTLKTILAAGVAGALMMAVAQQAAAQELGPYVAADLGWHTPEGISARSQNDATDGLPYRYDFQQEDNIASFGRLGWQVHPNWRVEIEGGFRAGAVESVKGTPTRALPNAVCNVSVSLPASTNCAGPGGHIEAYTLMGNVIYDFFPSSRVRPFIGAGIGAARVDLKVGGKFNSATPGGVFRVDDDDTAFAWQFLGGMSFDISDRLTGDLTYRYLDGNDIRFGSSSSGSAQPGSFKGAYEDQSLTVGLRYSFAQPAPPPPPPAPPPPPPEAPPPPPAPPPAPVYEAREFIVYFPFDQSILTPEAQSVVSEAAQYASAGNATQIVVVGHADTSGSAKYNVGLSQRRSKAVADALVGLGVNSATLSVDWKGESAPAVATGDGVKEPLNRRSTISINF